ncbi:MAG: M36 family metallopeptidase [Solirubrobacterales bacterium]
MAFAGPAKAGEAALADAEAPAAQLERVSANTLGSGDVASYAQEVGGVPVVGASVTVVDLPGEPAEVLFDKSVDGLEAPGEPAIDRAAAVATALEAIGAPHGGEVAARLVIDATRGNQLVWEVTHTDIRPISDRLVTVSAATGEVLADVDRLVRATGQANLFRPNAVVENGSYSGISDSGDADSANLTSLRSAVVLEELKDGQTCLVGAWAKVKFSPQSRRVCKDNLDWSGVTRAKNRFEALMAYFHVTEIQQYIQTLDLDPINEERQDVIANSISEDNSYYSPGSDRIQLGTGGVDDGEDGDVIVHEYGHAVHDAQAPQAFGGFNNEAGAMGEGFGDYLAAVHQNEIAGPDAEWTPCIMEWDATSYDFTPSNGTCLRRADDPSSHPVQVSQCGGAGNFHCVGQVWSSALLELRTTLGFDAGPDSVMDTLVLQSHFGLPANPSFAEAAQAILTADEGIYGGAHCSDLEAEFEARAFGSFSC